MDLAKSAFLAIIDGPEPGKWQPWDTSFSELSEQVLEADLALPSNYEHMKDHRLGLLLDSREALSKRKNWSRVVGAVVDGRMPTEWEVVKKAFDLLCAKLQGTSDGWFRKYGFYVAVVLPPDSTSEHRNFWHELKLKATDLLGEQVDVKPVSAEAHIRYLLPDFNRRMIFAIAKDLRSQG